MTMTVKELLLRMSELREDAERIRKELARSVTGPGKDTGKIRTLEKKLQKTRSEYLEEYDMLLSGINGLDQHVYREVLKKRYLDAMPFWRIARDMGYSEQYIKNIHTKALRAFSEAMKHKKKM